ncbi:zinc-binding dehydrogenase [Planctomycetota bacterium]
MKAMFLTEVGKMEIMDIDQPEPGEGEVLLKMGSVGICGSDVHYFKNGHIGDDHAVFPQGLGHEPSGVITETGKGVKASRAGERVTVEPGIGCGTCEFCRSAHANLCPDVVFLGSPGVQGAYKEYMVIPAENCFKVSDSISLGETAMFEPFGVGVEAASIACIKPGDSACVLGCGSIGLSTMAAARALGVTEVYAVDPLEWRRQAAADSFCADHVCDNSRTDVAEWLMDLTGGRGVDIVFEASGDNKAFTLTPELAVRGGTVVIIGIPAQDDYIFNAHSARRKALTFVNCRRFNRKLPAAIRFAEKGLIDLSKLITHEFSLEDTAQGFELVDGYKDGVIKAVVNIK